MKRRSLIALPVVAGVASHWPTQAAQIDPVASTRELLQSIMPTSHPRLLVRASELGALRTFLAQDPRAGGLATALKNLDVDAAQPIAQEPNATLAKGSAATQAARDDWRNASAAAIDTQLLALRWMLRKAPADLATGVRWLRAMLDWRMSTQEDFARNPEAFVQAFHALLFAFDWLYEGMTPSDRQAVQAALAARADTLFEFMRKRLTLVEPMVPTEGLSYPIRYLSTMGHASMTLWGHHPAAQEQLAWIVTFYQSQFPVWGGNDGGWSEGIEYQTSGLSQHLRFLEDLALLGHSAPVERPFWRNTGYFLARFLPPYESSSFSDLPTAPKPTASRRLLMDKLARIHRDGRLLTLGQRYGSAFPTGTNYYQYGAVDSIFHVWRVSIQPRLEALPIDDLPRSWLFADIGWVSIQSSWEARGKAIMLGFKSSPIGSISHSFADQNAFVINAFRHAMAISTGMRDWYGSPHYEEWTRATRSKNAVLVNGEGAPARDATATGKVVRFVSGRQTDFVTGDASKAYGRVAKVALRHILFVDRRYFVMLDELASDRPAVHQWLLHAPVAMSIDGSAALVDTSFGDAGLQTKILTPVPTKLRITQTDYATPAPQAPANAVAAQWHAVVETLEPSARRVFLAFLRPWQGFAPTQQPLALTTTIGHALRMDSDTVLISEEAVNKTVTATHELAGRAAYQSSSRLVMVEGTRLVCTLATFQASIPLTVELETAGNRWQLDIAPHATATLLVGLPKTAITVDGPTGMQWISIADRRGVQLQLPASADAAQVSIGF